MALPQQLMTARATNATPVSSVDNVLGEAEQAIADILGVPVNTPITEVVTGRAKYAQVTDSAAIANTAVETAFNKTYSIPANSLAVGNIIRVKAFGTYGAVSLPNLTLRIRIGANNVSLHAITAGTNTGLPWFVEVDVIVRAIGASGQIIVGPQNAISQANGTDPSGAQSKSYLLTGFTTYTIDTTAAKTVDVTAQWGTASASNTITMRGLTVEIIPAASTS